MEERPASWPPKKRPFFYLSVGADGAVRVSYPMIAVVLSLVVSALGLWQKLATRADLDAHEAREHVLLVAESKEPVTLREVVSRDHERLADLDRLSEAQRRSTAALDAVRDQVFALRAEALAETAAGRPRVRARDRAAIRDHVRSKVLENLQAGKRADDGVEGYLAP